MDFNTKVIHTGAEPDKGTGAIATPIFQTSSFAQNIPGEHKGYAYSRVQNPTRKALENALASLENGSHGFAFASGLAATDCVLRLFNPGDEIIAGEDIYGGTYRLFTQLFQKYGLKFKFVNMDEPKNIAEAITDKTKLVWLETPTNPLLKIVDIEEVTKLVKKKNSNILVAVDNTFASPYLQRPIDLGADIVMHSATKYIGGHSDLMMGALVVNNEDLVKQIHFIQYAAGAIANPMDCFLALRGIKTLHVRMQRHCENARRVAEFLVNHSKVDKVYYPGFANHPSYLIAKKQMKDFGGVVTFSLKVETKEATFSFLEKLRYFVLAESLGGVESMVNHSATMSHGSVPKEEKQKKGITDSLLRLSIGIEAIDDLLNDLEQALS